MTMLRAPNADSYVFGAPGVPGVATGNKGAFARFSRVPVKNHALSADAGSSVFQEEIHVSILMPGDTLSIPVRRVKLASGDIVGQEWIDGFPREWKAFNEGSEQIPDGTPLAEWPAASVSLIATLKAINIHTVEALATVHDAAMDRIGMGARELAAQARAFLDVRKDSAAAMKHAHDAEQARAAMQAMTEKMEDMERQLNLISRSGKILAGAQVEQTFPVTPAPLDPMTAAAVASGAVPLETVDMSAVGRRGPGRPPKL